MSEFTDCTWQSRDGLTLHYRDYPGPAGRPALLCLPGLTRNARDFEALAAALAGEWRVVCPDLRGRGDSDYARDSASYNPLQYVDDTTQLLESAKIDRFVAIGTSLGGLITMLLAMTDAARIAGAVINDIGPVIEPAGLERIRGYVGQGRSFPTWMHAARALQEQMGDHFPGRGIDEWLVLAKRCMTLGSNGRIVFDYDMKIAEPFAQPGGEAGADLWPGWQALAGRPLLVVRGALSDILSASTARAMCSRIEGAELLTIPATGHAPTLDEPEARAAISRLLARVA